MILPHLPISVLSFVLKLILLSYIGHKESFGSSEQCLEGHGFHPTDVVAGSVLVRYFL